ncbi:clathrin coat assembly protein AP180-like [Salvia miltiorrhiza]|uniref:clathrin coat assembly protein AP180-like n=1 Tax=Salvia miltiorrhiza TaxID=226208 RepID=UPI0025AC608D|nr:clathrin coat assembly protein AP180-like [Salvia miltiorrhiza]
MPSKLQRAIGAVKDQTSISLARVSNTTSSSLEVAVLKATTHDDDPIDEKFVHEVLLLVSSNKFHAAACARAIGKRIGRTRNWMVALKSLMLVLRIFQDGDPYFPREVFHAMKRGAKILNLASFRDESSSSSPWDFTSFVRTFALYLDERLECFLTGKLQRRRHVNGLVKESPTYQRVTARGRRPSEPVLDMKPAMLLDRITYWQRLLDRAIATRPTGDARINRLVQTCLYAIVQESFDLYKDISDGLSLILDSFFHLQFQNCVNAFHACAKAAKQFKELNNFYTLCKSIGVGRSSEYPSVQSISEDLIEALQEFLNEQSAFLSSNAKATPEKARERGREGERSSSSEVGSPCTSLQDLINATATKTAACPAISIDLEAYAEPPQRDEAFMMSETSSVRSLPVTYSMVDLISLWDGSDLDDREQQQQQQQQQQHGSAHSSPYDNWELVLTETLASPSPLPSPSPSPSLLPMPNNKPTQAAEVGPSAASAGPVSDNWELILFESEPSPPPPPQPYLQTYPMLPNNYYNPFLVDPMEPQGLQHSFSLPAFRAVPPIPIHFQNQTPFLCQNEIDPSFSRSNSLDQQFLAREQQQWLMKQNNVIAKYM